MSNDMRIVKFKMVIKEIWENLDEYVLTKCLDINDGCYTALLAIIYDYDKLNDYGKIIMEQVCELYDNEEFSDRVDFVERCKDTEYRMKAAKELVTDLNRPESSSFLSFRDKEKMYFIFWSLMILTVDDTDKEERLSLICDFAKMLKIRDEEIMDMVQIIKAIYHVKGDFAIQTRNVVREFSEVIKKYKVEVATSAMDPSDMIGKALGSVMSSLAPGDKSREALSSMMSSFVGRAVR